MTPRGAPDLLSGYLERRAHQSSRWKRLTQNERVKWIQSLSVNKQMKREDRQEF